GSGPWSCTKMAPRTVASHVSRDGMTFMNSADASGERNMVAVKAGDKGDVTGTNLVWQSKERTCPYVPSMLTWGDHVYYLEDHGYAGCFAARTGEVVYHE